MNFCKTAKKHKNIFEQLPVQSRWGSAPKLLMEGKPYAIATVRKWLALVFKSVAKYTS